MSIPSIAYRRLDHLDLAEQRLVHRADGVDHLTVSDLQPGHVRHRPALHVGHRHDVRLRKEQPVDRLLEHVGLIQPETARGRHR